MHKRTRARATAPVLGLCLPILGLSLAALPGAALAGGGLSSHLSTSNSRLALFKAQTRLIDTRLSQEYADSDRYQPKSSFESGPLPRYTGNYRGAYLKVAKDCAQRHNVPVDLFLRLVQQESGWNMGAVSAKGAMGLAQLMPQTAALLGVDIKDPKQNLDGGARYLRMMYDRFGSWKLALAAYNAGPLAVGKSGGVPNFQETQTYVASILGG